MAKSNVLLNPYEVIQCPGAVLINGIRATLLSYEEYERTTGKKVGECVADKHGKYSFRGLTAANHFIIAHHPESTFNAVIQDNVVPK